ncbi:hypothetical protein GR212_26840 [Rhizobium lusitanum]|uniref:DUF6894 domain-containing protein n=1 Tax=Rhizobium lusitanum TaxID=293958 RepID=A0A6L9UFT4_9HYPH|nr:hypothetical protein [Rhizobium lusitanum]NEI73182.1 hypothetical protein [Rhizobium lusitanum]
MNGDRRIRRYFFQLRDGNNFYKDVEVVELPDQDSAVVTAVPFKSVISWIDTLGAKPQ